MPLQVANCFALRERDAPATAGGTPALLPSFEPQRQPGAEVGARQDPGCRSAPAGETRLDAAPATQDRGNAPQQFFRRDRRVRLTQVVAAGDEERSLRPAHFLHHPVRCEAAMACKENDLPWRNLRHALAMHLQDIARPYRAQHTAAGDRQLGLAGRLQDLEEKLLNRRRALFVVRTRSSSVVAINAGVQLSKGRKVPTRLGNVQAGTADESRGGVGGLSALHPTQWPHLSCRATPGQRRKTGAFESPARAPPQGFP